MSKHLDYDKLLDDWADMLFEIADKHEKKIDFSKTGSFEHGYHKGMSEAFIMSISKLTMLEKRHAAKYKIEE